MTDAATLTALIALAFAAVWTPGPNNIMLANSGATFGFGRTLPHALGVALGFPLMMFIIALGLGEVFRTYEGFRIALTWLGAALLLYLAWRIATAGRSVDGVARGRPFTFVEAAGFQWINPKAWAMAISTAGTFVTGVAPVREALVCALVFVVAGMTSANSWAMFGAAIRSFLSTDLRLRVFNIIMGLLVASYVVFLFAERP
ncbi:MAG: LysE family translocator [Pseudomonadota bacterium]